MKSEARSPSAEGTEASVAKRSAESLAPDEQWMEKVCQRENLWRAFKRVKGNGGSPGVDGMRRTLPRRFYEPVLHHTRLEPAPNQLQKALICYPPCNPTHQFVVVYSIEELLQIEINHPAVSSRDMLLGRRPALAGSSAALHP